MAYSTPEHLAFHPLAGPTIRAACEGGAWSSDVGVLFLRGIDRQLGLPARLAAAIHDPRPPSSIAPPLRALWAQRIAQIAAGAADGHEANRLRRDPLGQRGVERLPRAPAPALARAPTFSRLAPRGHRQVLSRRPQAWGAPGVASAPEPPAAIVRARAHPDAPPHGQQAFAFSNHDDQRDGSGPLVIFAGLSGALGTAGRRPGPRPTGAEHALRWGRLLACLRRPWPRPPLLGLSVVGL